MISVCMTTYNGERYILEQLNSILCQLSDSDEIIISDDGSTDTTLDIINSYHDSRIKIFHHNKDNNFLDYTFYKITKNFENAILNAKGNLIFLADQDDIWFPEKIDTIKPLLNDNLLVLHDCSIINQNNQIINDSYYELNKSKSGIFRNIINSSYLGCCMAFRRELLDFVLPFPSKPVPHDIWFGLIAEWKNKVVFSDKKLLYYRRHSSNQSTSGENSNFSIKMRIYYRIILVFAFLKRIGFGMN